MGYFENKLWCLWKSWVEPCAHPVQPYHSQTEGCVARAQSCATKPQSDWGLCGLGPILCKSCATIPQSDWELCGPGPILCNHTTVRLSTVWPGPNPVQSYHSQTEHCVARAQSCAIIAQSDWGLCGLRPILCNHSTVRLRAMWPGPNPVQSYHSQTEGCVARAQSCATIAQSDWGLCGPGPILCNHTTVRLRAVWPGPNPVQPYHSQTESCVARAQSCATIAQSDWGLCGPGPILCKSCATIPQSPSMCKLCAIIPQSDWTLCGSGPILCKL